MNQVYHPSLCVAFQFLAYQERWPGTRVGRRGRRGSLCAFGNRVGPSPSWTPAEDPLLKCTLLTWKCCWHLRTVWVGSRPVARFYWSASCTSSSACSDSPTSQSAQFQSRRPDLQSQVCTPTASKWSRWCRFDLRPGARMVAHPAYPTPVTPAGI